jgi:hypothetical protein
MLCFRYRRFSLLVCGPVYAVVYPTQQEERPIIS